VTKIKNKVELANTKKENEYEQMMKRQHKEFEKSSKKIEEDFRFRVKILGDKNKLKLAYTLKLYEDMVEKNKDLDVLFLST
jgi:hypothetical protein